MARRVSMLLLAATLLTAVGCRRSCGGLFTSGSRHAPCHLTGGEVCHDGVPGVPVSGPGVVPGVVVPGGPVPGGRPDELPYPQPTDLIPRPGVPFAPPGPAPGDPGGTFGGLPAPKGPGTPVKGPGK